MSSPILRALTTERIERLTKSFATSKSVFWENDEHRLFHAGEFGSFRERAVRELLRLYVPQQFEIGNGFVITDCGDVSTQCDVVIYDKSRTPSIVTDSHQAFYPIETVVAVGEVKSDIQSSAKLAEALNKLARVKMLREKIEEPAPYRMHSKSYNPTLNPFDQVFTFLICNSLKFGFDQEAFLQGYDGDISRRFYHNTVLSVMNGLAFYRSPVGAMHYPCCGAIQHDSLWNRKPTNSNSESSHIEQFLVCLYNAMNVVTLLEPDMVRYLIASEEIAPQRKT